MLNYEKIGNFLRELRVSKGYSQEKVAEMLFVTRQVISKWERGLSIPSNEMLLSLCKLYEVTANEIFAGEKSNHENKNIIENISVEVLKDGRVRLKKKTIIYFSIIILLILLFFIYYFLSTYNQMQVYAFSGNSDNFFVDMGIIMKSNEQIYFDIGELNCYNDKKVDQIHLYYYKNDQKILIYEDNQDKVILYDKKGNNQYFNFNDWDYIIDNLYIDVTYNELSVNETIKLETERRYTNSNLFFKDSEPLVKSNSDNYNDELIKVPSKIKDKFHYNENDSVYELKETNKNFDLYISYDPFSSTLSVREKYLDSSKVWIYTLLDEENFLIQYNYYKKDNLDSCSTLMEDEIVCETGSCTNHKKEYSYFLETYKESYLK